MTLSRRDKQIIWHPFTQEKTALDVINIKRASGAYVYDENDKGYLDLISSWWVNIHGHTHPEIARSIYEQALTLEHVIFAGFTHEPAVNLCEDLQTILPVKLSRFFFSDNGSTAVEVAIKMAYQYWRNLGHRERTTFLSFEGGYHGDTFGAMSIGGTSRFHDQFKDLCFKILSIPYPSTWDDDDEIEAKEVNAIKVLQEFLDEYQSNIAAIILEPLIQGAGGMRVCRAEFIKKVVNLVHKKDILVIFDEIMTGFCRTGTYFAFHQLDIVPDFLCIAKGLTGGFLPLALTITSNDVYETFLGDDFKRAFAHGHSYTANPLACSAAIASLGLLKRQECQDAITNINQMHKEGIKFLKSICYRVERFRIIGTIAAFDVKYLNNLMPLVKERFLEEGILLRPLANTIYLLPPYCVSQEEIELAYNKIARVLNSL